MNKKWIIYIIVGLLVSVSIGIVVYKFFIENNQELQGTELVPEQELAEDFNNINDTRKENSIETSANEETISPNAIIIKKEYFKSCDHLKRTVEDIPKELVNGKKEDVVKKYTEWKIENFTPTEITLYREVNGNCGEHYFVQDHYGEIGIYTLNENDEKTLKEDTEISTKYLPDSDLELLKKGVKIVGKTKLIEFLEDYE